MPHVARHPIPFAHPVRAAVIALAVAASPLAQAEAPSIDSPPVSGQRATRDRAVVISNEAYTGFGPVSYATRDAEAFVAWLTRTRGLPSVNVIRLPNATKRQISEAVARAASDTPSDGTLWVYYAGHGLGMQLASGGAPERVLLGINAVARSDELTDYVVPVSELQRTAATSAAAKVVFVLDACFNNAGRGGGALVDGRFAVPVGAVRTPGRVVVWSATDANETAVPYAPANHGAFTYFAVGALSGWADGVDGASDGAVTLDEAQAYVSRAMASVGILGQTPQLVGVGGLVASQGKLATAPGAFGAAAGGAPATAVAGAVSGGFGFNGSLSAELASQVCDDDAKTKAEAAQLARAEQASAKVRAEATAAWRGLEPQLDGCLKLDDRKACIAAAEQFIAAGKAASVTVGESREVVKTSCGDRSRVVASRTVPVSVSEVGLAEAKLAALKAPKGASGGGAGSDWVSPTLGVMKWIPAGTFTMGSPASEAGRGADEAQHSVTLTKGFHLMEHEVTQGQFEAVTGRNPATGTMVWDGKDQGACATYGDVSLVGASYPAICVSWSDAASYANAVSSREGLTACYGADGSVVRGCTGYRLPTEAEWERAARGGGSAVYAGTSEPVSVCGYGNVGNPSSKQRFGWSWNVFACEDGAAVLASVKSYRPNGYGLYDMTGNVWEWTADWHGAYGGAAVDPTGAASGSRRVLRGGSWYDDPVDARVAFRFRNDPGNRYYNLGLRLLRSVP